MEERIKSKNLFEKLKTVIPGGVNSPTRAFKGLGVEPLVVRQGIRDKIIDIDDQIYIDFNHAWGSLILGHAHPDVVEAAKAQMERGSSFGITTELEYRFAKKMQELIPFLEKSRVVASGTEATMTAIRIARGYTKREGILKFNGHYHGHSDAFLIKAGSGLADHCLDSSSQGVPPGVIRYSYSLPFNDCEALERFFKDNGNLLAAVILEPIAGNMGVVLAKNVFIKRLRALCDRYGVVLIFDEVMTGFRVAKGGAAQLYQVQFDLATYSKIIGGGFPVGLVGGRSELMDLLAPVGPVYQAGTLSGNPVALCAGLAVLEKLSTPGFYEVLEQKMDLFLNPIERKIRESSFPLVLNRAGGMFSMFWGVSKVESYEDLKELDRELFNRFFAYLFEKGIYFSPSAYEASFVSFVHEEKHLIYTQKVLLDFLRLIEDEFSSGSIKSRYATSKINEVNALL